MGKVVADISMSLDGYINGPNVMGGGELIVSFYRRDWRMSYRSISSQSSSAAERVSSAISGLVSISTR